MNISIKYDIAKAVLGGVIIGASLTTGSFITGAEQAKAQTAQVRPHKPCQEEDSSWCVWDARHMGNGVGRSFWTDRQGHVHYVRHAVAHRLIFGS